MRIIVIGCGRVGASLVRGLVTAGHDVSVVDSDPAAFERLGPTVVCRRLRGHGMDREVLSTAGIEHAEGLAAVTGSDEVNAVISRVALRRFGVPRVVARIYDPAQADLYRRLGVQTISPVSWGVSRLFELLVAPGLGSMSAVGAGQVDLVDVRIPHLLVGKPLGELEVTGEIKVVAVTRSGRTFLPEGPVRFEERDLAHLVVTAGAVSRLEALLGEK